MFCILPGKKLAQRDEIFSLRCSLLSCLSSSRYSKPNLATGGAWVEKSNAFALLEEMPIPVDGSSVISVYTDDFVFLSVPLAQTQTHVRKKNLAGEQQYKMKGVISGKKPQYVSLDPEEKGATPGYSDGEGYRDNPASSIAMAQAKVDAVTEVARQNIEAAISRGERLDEMEAKADELSERATDFKRQSVAVKRRARCGLWKINCVIFTALLVILLVVLGSFGVFNGAFKSHHKGGKSEVESPVAPPGQNLTEGGNGGDGAQSTLAPPVQTQICGAPISDGTNFII
eukprot:g54035.t1